MSTETRIVTASRRVAIDPPLEGKFQVTVTPSIEPCSVPGCENPVLLSASEYKYLFDLESSDFEAMAHSVDAQKRKADHQRGRSWEIASHDKKEEAWFPYLYYSMS
jgi:hypothetical protein